MAVLIAAVDFASVAFAAVDFASVDFAAVDFAAVDFAYVVFAVAVFAAVDFVVHLALPSLLLFAVLLSYDAVADEVSSSAPTPSILDTKEHGR